MRRRQVVAILGPTAAGKSALALALAASRGGEIINCDSTAVYRGFDIGTDKVPLADQRGIPHHLVDIVEPTAEYTAAQYARDAAAAIRDIHARGGLPFLVGGTGFYYRALTRGLFPGPGRDSRLRARLEAIATRRGVMFLHRLLRRIDPASADRIQPRDLKRSVRALEVFFLTGRPLTEHFAATVSPIPEIEVLPIAVRLPADETSVRVTKARGSAVRARVAGRDPGVARPWDSGNRPSVWRARVPPGSRAPARGPRRGRDARADRAGESPVRQASVDLVPQRA